MLSPQVVEFVARIKSNYGFDITEAPKNTLLEVTTRNTTFHVLIVEPKNSVIVIDHPALKQLPVCYYQGSTAMGSIVRTGWIGIDLHMNMNPVTGGFMTTSPVKSFRIIDDLALSEKLMDTYRQYQKMPRLDVKAFEAKVMQIIESEFPPNQKENILALINEFNAEGKGVMLGILSRAHKAGKLAEALEILNRHLTKHWTYRPPEIRGSFITGEDVRYVELAYQELGIPFPDRV
ncbi:MAG: hypothetical protein UT43_C0020G0016 [Parcubacteria group bacterium GW2011_GWC1_39_29]|nr:MAG: hypothetical protein UT43_C0020G0016 [Parcubacteria group bacterium GW2011_GWC1_39_29]